MKFLKNVLLCGEQTDIGVEDGLIASIGKTDAEGEDFGGAKIYPGLIDTHIHGCIGCDTMDEEDTLGKMSDFLLSRGTTSWCPTTMTVAYEDIIRTTKKNINLSHGATILGFHLEGPFINPRFKGAQNPNHIFKPDISLIKSCDNVKKITILMALTQSAPLSTSVTVSPSAKNSPAAFISRTRCPLSSFCESLR